MKEILTWEDAELFDYINEVEFLYVPYMDDYKYRINIEFGKASSGAVNKIESPAFGYSEIATIFMNRFNEGKLSKQKHYNEYIDNVENIYKLFSKKGRTVCVLPVKKVCLFRA